MSILKYGSSGSEVKRLQQALGVSVDGAFGNQTRSALMNWQRSNGLSPDGVFGPQSSATMWGGGSLGSSPSTGGVQTLGVGQRTTPKALTPSGGGLGSTHSLGGGSSVGASVASLTPAELANFTLQEQRAREANQATLDRLDFGRNTLTSRRILDQQQNAFDSQQGRERLLNQLAARGLAGSGIQLDQRDKLERNILMANAQRDQSYNSQLQEVELSRSEAAKALALLLSQIEGQRQAALATRRSQLQGAF